MILDRGPHLVDSWRFDVAGPRLASGRPNAALAQAIAALPPVAATLRAAELLIIERASARIAGRQLRIDLAVGDPDPIAAALGAVTARWSTTPLCDVRFEGHGALAGLATPLPMPGLVDLSADDLDGTAASRSPRATTRGRPAGATQRGCGPPSRPSRARSGHPGTGCASTATGRHPITNRHPEVTP